MNGEEYLERFSKVETYGEKQRLLAEAQAAENVDRELFARKRDQWHVPELDDPYKGLVPVFDQKGNALFTERKWFEEEEEIPRLFDLGREERKKRRAGRVTVDSLDKFKEQFLHTFAANGLRLLNWDNVVAAGGSVQACVAPIPKEHDQTFGARRRFYHDEAYPGSDVDLFLYGLTAEEANAKLLEIYDAVSKYCPHEVICFRSANAVTMVSEYPFRHIQVVLRIYSSPYEILAGFDVDSCTFLYDGSQVYTTPRGHHAVTSGCNTVDISRRSPSYEVRLAKYAHRGFEVLIPSLKPEKIDPNIFDKPWGILKGLQKLVVMERLRTARDRLEYQTRHQKESGMLTRLESLYLASRNMERIEKAKGLTEESNYATVFLPWGPGFSAEQTKRIMKRKDVILNSTKFRGDREYFLHPCFFGTAEEILKDCSPGDPPIPDDVPSLFLRNYVRGELRWMEDDPGRQQIGSFHPITDQDWEAGVYFEGPRLEIFQAMNTNNPTFLSNVLSTLRQTWSVFDRDYLGRSPLHVGLFAGSVECCIYLLESDLVDPTLRLPDGRSSLHLVAEYNRPQVLDALLAAVRRLQERRAVYDALSKEEKEAIAKQGEKPPRNVPLEEFVGLKTFDQKWTALQIAVVLGRVEVTRKLLEEFGADGSAPCPIRYHLKSNRYTRDEIAVPLLLLAPYEREKDTQAQLVELLLEHGYSSANAFFCSTGSSTALHVCALFGNIGLLELIVTGLEKRDRSRILCTLLSWEDSASTTPLHCAVKNGHFGCAQFLYERLPHSVVTQAMRDDQRKPRDRRGRVDKVSPKTLAHHAAENLAFRWAALLERDNKDCHMSTNVRRYMEALKRLHIFQHGGEEGKDLLWELVEADDGENDTNPNNDQLRKGIFAAEPPTSLDEAAEKEAIEKLQEKVDTAAEMLLWALEKESELGEVATKVVANNLGPISWSEGWRGTTFKLGSFQVSHSGHWRAEKAVSLADLAENAYEALCVLAFSSTVSHQDSHSEMPTTQLRMVDDVEEKELRKIIIEREKADSRSYLTLQAKTFCKPTWGEKMHENKKAEKKEVEVKVSSSIASWLLHLVARVDVLQKVLREAEKQGPESVIKKLWGLLARKKRTSQGSGRQQGDGSDGNLLRGLFSSAIIPSADQQQVIKLAKKVIANLVKPKSSSSGSRNIRKGDRMSRALALQEMDTAFVSESSPRQLSMLPTSWERKGLKELPGATVAFQAAFDGDVDKVLQLVSEEPLLLLSWTRDTTALVTFLISRCERGRRVALLNDLHQQLLEFKDKNVMTDPVRLLCKRIPMFLDDVLDKLATDAPHLANSLFGGYTGDSIGRLDLGALAVLENDPDLLKVWLRIVSDTMSSSNRESFQKELFSPLLTTCILLSRVDCLRELVVNVGGGVKWNGVATSLGLSKSYEYHGMSTSLRIQPHDGAFATQLQRGSLQLPETWAEHAAISGSWDMLFWLVENVDQVADWFDEFLEHGDRRDGTPQQLGRISAVVQQFQAGDMKKSKGAILASLVVQGNEGDGFGAFSLNGRSLLHHVLENDAYEQVLEKVPNLPSLLNEPCCMCRNPDLDSNNENDRVIKQWPVHHAAQIRHEKKQLKQLRFLLQHGADPLQRTAPNEQNVLQLVADSFGAKRFAAVLNLFREEVGVETLWTALNNKDATGKNCFHKLFRRLPTPKVVALLDEFLSPEWLIDRAGSKDGSTLLHDGLEDRNEGLCSINSHQRFRFLLETIPEEAAATEENLEGVTAVDLFLKKRRVQGEKSFSWSSAGLQLLPDLDCAPVTTADLLPLEEHPLAGIVHAVETDCVSRNPPPLDAVQEKVRRAHALEKPASQSKWRRNNDYAWSSSSLHSFFYSLR